jgi:hypothetical protein
MIGNSNKQAHNRDFWESSLKSKISSKIINGSEQKVAAPMYRIMYCACMGANQRFALKPSILANNHVHARVPSHYNFISHISI